MSESYNKGIFKIQIVYLAFKIWSDQSHQLWNYRNTTILEKILSSLCPPPPPSPPNLSRLWSVPPHNLATVDVTAFSSKQAVVWDSLCVFLSLSDPSSHFKSQIKTTPFLLLSLYILMSLFRCSDLTLDCNTPKQNLH